MAIPIILYDARGNEIRSQMPDIVNNETFTDARTATNVLGAANAEVLMDLMGCSIATFDVRSAASVCTFVFEGSYDGSNYIALPAFKKNQILGAITTAEDMIASVTTATTVNAQYVVGVTGMRRVRLRISAFTSGNITVAARATHANFAIYTRPIPSTLHVTATAAANTIATATLPAAGVGLFHYITNINLMRNATAILAGGATLIHTSTNLPGSPAWSVGNVMVAGGTQTDLAYTPTTPLKSLVANTATTIVMPAAGAAVLNRINVSYYIGA